MSHVAEASEFAITDLDVLEASCPETGMRLVRNQTTHNWFKQFMNDWSVSRSAVAQGRDPKTFGKCEHAIVLQDATGKDYEIGLVKNRNGEGWVPVYDVYGPGQRLEQKAGPNLRALKTAYEERLATKHLRKRGMRVTKSVDSKGRIVLMGVKR